MLNTPAIIDFVRTTGRPSTGGVKAVGLEARRGRDFEQAAALTRVSPARSGPGSEELARKLVVWIPSRGRNFEAMDPLEWLTRLADHTPILSDTAPTSPPTASAASGRAKASRAKPAKGSRLP